MNGFFHSLTIIGIVQLFVLSMIIVFGGILLLRISGKKTLGQMTFPQAIIAFSLGSLLAMPFSQFNSIIETLLVVLFFVLTVVLIERLVFNSKSLEETFDSKPIVLIENGKVVHENLKKARMTKNSLEGKLREKGISCLEDVRTVTLEVSGNIGYEEIDSYNPQKPNLFDKLT